MVSATAPVTIRSRLRTRHVKAMRDLGCQPKQVTHHGFPFASVGLQVCSISEMKYQPVGHFMGNNLAEKRTTVLIQQHWIKP